jgi:hypothetical protein
MANVEVLVVAGGGGGANDRGGGGGGGGLLYSAAQDITLEAYTVTIGAGGSAGANGQDSVFAALTAIGGGAGNSILQNGLSGGSGGGAGANALTTQTNGGAGTSGQGYAGGNGAGKWDFPRSSGGGGGGGSVGVGGAKPNGGTGVSSSISGASVMYAAGGGGGDAGWDRTSYGKGTGGSGIGGNGGGKTAGDKNATAGATNTGSGGGGGGSDGTVGAGGAGGSGIVIISYSSNGSDGVLPTSTGGTITTSGGKTIHTFTTSGTFTPVMGEVAPPALSIDYEYKRNITIDSTKVDAALTDFPLTVNLTENNFDFSKIRTDGFDVGFYDSSNNPLKFEREYFLSGGFYFDGIDDRVNVSNINLTADFEIGMTLRLTTGTVNDYTTATGEMVLGNYPTLTTAFIRLKNTNEIEIAMSSDAARFLWTTTGIDFKEPHTYRFVKTGTSIELIIDGVSQGTVTTALGFNFTTIFAGGNNTNYNVNGYLNKLYVISAGTLIHKWDSVVNSFLDNVGTNHGTITGAIHEASNAVYHVKVPTVSDTVDTVVKMLYGSTSAITDQSDAVNVWDSNYSFVHHFGDSLLDSTGKITLTQLNTTVVAGHIGKSRSFNSANSYLKMTEALDTFSPTGGTLLAVIKDIGTATHSHLIEARANLSLTTSRTVSVHHRWGSTLHYFDSGDGISKYNRVTGTAVTVANQWAEYEAIKNVSAGTMKTRSNNTDFLSASGLTLTVGASAINALVGQAVDEGVPTTIYSFDGLISEMRYSKVPRSDAWLKAEYNSLFSTLQTVGSELANITASGNDSNSVFFGMNF